MKILIYTVFPLLMFVGCDEPEEKENEKPVYYFSKVLGEFDAEWDTASMKPKMVDSLFQEQRHLIGPPIRCQKSQCINMELQMQ